MKMPCEDCISYVICRSIVLDNIKYPAASLANKCELFRKYINDAGYPDFNLLYEKMENGFNLNFKMMDKQSELINKTEKQRKEKKNKSIS